jgi:hypothetical protein
MADLATGNGDSGEHGNFGKDEVNPNPNPNANTNPNPNANTNPNRSQGWMRAHVMHTEEGVHYYDPSAETGHCPVDVWLQDLLEFFTPEEMDTDSHNMDDLGRQRQLWHWLDLGDESIDNAIRQQRKKLLLLMWKNEVFHPFVDMSTAETMISEAEYKIWVIRLSTTVPGKLTISYPILNTDKNTMSRSPLIVHHSRIDYRDDGMFDWSKRGLVYPSIDVLIDSVTKEVTTTVKQIYPDINYVEPDPYDDS